MELIEHLYSKYNKNSNRTKSKRKKYDDNDCDTYILTIRIRASISRPNFFLRFAQQCKAEKIQLRHK